MSRFRRGAISKPNSTVVVVTLENKKRIFGCVVAKTFKNLSLIAQNLIG